MALQLHRTHLDPLLMGIVNVTPDSFSDGGRYLDRASLLQQCDRLLAAGAGILDIGGESTRPFSEPVPLQEELDRVIPAITAIRRRHDIPISIDTTKAEVARQALDAGADIVNDISSCRFDDAMLPLIAQRQCPIIIMHMQGNPKTMQLAPTYHDVVQEALDFLQERIDHLRRHGIESEIVVDPGIGFGKTLAHNLALMRHLSRFKELGCPVLIGHSRKSFLGQLLQLEVSERDEATAILSLLCAQHGADIIRVHDVLRTRRALQLATALQGSA